MSVYYEDESVTLYHGDARDVVLRQVPAPDLAVDLVCTGPPYPNRAGHFLDGIEAARVIMRDFSAPRWMVFWHQLLVPPVRGLPLVAHHIWHRTNTNRPDNYEAIYEFAQEAERPSAVFPYAVIHPGLTGCHEATGHPTQKNEKLMRRLLTLRPNVKRVLDPFAGSGSTLVAAKYLGLTAVGVEIEERYCEDIARRLSQDVLDFGDTA